MKCFLLILTATLLSGVVLLPGARPSAAASGEASADTLRQLEAEFMKAAADHGSQGYMSYYAGMRLKFLMESRSSGEK
jgi:hypothetical protein